MFRQCDSRAHGLSSLQINSGSSRISYVHTSLVSIEVGVLPLAFMR